MSVSDNRTGSVWGAVLGSFPVIGDGLCFVLLTATNERLRNALVGIPGTETGLKKNKNKKKNSF